MIPNVSAGALVDPAWGNEVTDALNGIQSGTASGNTDANGLITITFPAAFADSTYVFVGTPVQSASSTQRSVHINNKNAGSITVRYTANDGPLASTAVTIDWIAIGALP